MSNLRSTLRQWTAWQYVLQISLHEPETKGRTTCNTQSSFRTIKHSWLILLFRGYPSFSKFRADLSVKKRTASTSLKSRSNWYRLGAPATLLKDTGQKGHIEGHLPIFIYLSLQDVLDIFSYSPLCEQLQAKEVLKELPFSHLRDLSFQCVVLPRKRQKRREASGPMGLFALTDLTLHDSTTLTLAGSFHILSG